MINIAYPKFDFKIKQRDNRDIIYDEIRRGWFVLTPEEWVRQNFIQYLIQTKKYPAALIAVEKEIAVGELRKRFDLVIYKNAQPWMIVECKQMGVQLSHHTISQVLSYNSTIQAKYIAVSNGNHTVLWQIELDSIINATAFPDWDV